ncbi:hypothetical protein BO82DRAFT_388984 [Aspergillus uvarum CBS 121591]|uniref:Uncharacterized protein n=1 Tax=Aspergillus uvarum CBS 121591 TaxID=1448315 RepID=A0A319CJI1_9EURO|nr:hypothetical protein BO82DRAFT_388984 [Aspergillus uvarum CBS 121591]PYH85805.1 hypothetical protein BO82DRAFT_388984 [Aspergillus uvarum CBS 121591]
MVGTKSYLGTALLSLLALNSSGVLAHRWFNWQEDIRCDATGYFVPDNEADLISYLHHAQSQAARMIPFQNPDIAADKSKGYLSDDVTVITRFIKADDNWLSPVNDYNLPAGAQGVFASLEYSWIPTYNNWTQQYFYQKLASEFIPRFGEKYNVRSHWNKMQSHNETYTATIFPR